MKFRTAFNQKEFPFKGEVYKKPSKTIPNQGMTPRQIMTRFSQGLGVIGSKIPVYMTAEQAKTPSEFAHLDIDNMDLAEVQELHKFVQQRTRELEKVRDEMIEEVAKAQADKNKKDWELQEKKIEERMTKSIQEHLSRRSG